MAKFKRLPKKQPCKPCWELKYCPYGPLVEYFPLLTPNKADQLEGVKDRYSRALSKYKNAKTEEEIWDSIGFILYSDPSTWDKIAGYDPAEISCANFGHVCPVFIVCEGFTETRQGRRTGRSIPRDVMLKVVRRDNYICQVCGLHVLDDAIEIDQVIPHAKGGPTTPDNLRLLCRPCNRKKSDSLVEILDDFALPH